MGVLHSRNPHFDDGLVVWSDEYSGRYGPPPSGHSQQFDLQWKLARQDLPGYGNRPGASTDPGYIADRVFEWTRHSLEGQRGFQREAAGSRPLDHPLDPSLIRGKRCIDIGCGMGRWTKTMLALGAQSVLSVDVSENGLSHVKTFNDNVRRVNVMRLPEENPDLVGTFDFANFWGVAMCTEDPRLAFMNAARTVRPGGALYLMVYCPTSLHGAPEYVTRRRKFHSLESVDARLDYVQRVVSRRWDGACSLRENLKNLAKNVLGRPRADILNTLDMLEPYYNWVIPLRVVESWYEQAGFERPTHLNEYEPLKVKSAFHTLGIKRAPVEHHAHPQPDARSPPLA